MPMTPEEIERMIKTAIPDADVALTDLAGDGDHYQVTVASAAFSGKTRIAQHRMVMDAISGMGTTLHALSVTTQVKYRQEAL